MKIKSLTWFQTDYRYRTESIIGVYEILPHGQSWIATGFEEGAMTFSTLELAKKAVQDDFDRIIISVLEGDFTS